MAVKKTGVNKGMEKGVAKEQFKDTVICNKCGKEVNFMLGSELFQKCPRCGRKIERDLKHEKKEVKKIIKWDILRRSKKAILSFGFFLMLISIAYLVTAYFAGWYDKTFSFFGLFDVSYFALFVLPLVILAYLCMRKTRDKSASRKYRFYARVALILNFVTFGLIVISLLSTYTFDKIF